MNWMKAILWVISNAPRLYSIIKEILELIGKLSPQESSEAKAALTGCLKGSCSLRPLTDLHDRLNARAEHK